MTINLDNLRSGYEKFAYAFDKCKTCVTKGLPYDCHSIMHYPNDAFAAYGKKTIVSKNETICQTFTNGRHIILMFCTLALPWASLSPSLADRASANSWPGVPLTRISLADLGRSKIIENVNF